MRIGGALFVSVAGAVESRDGDADDFLIVHLRSLCASELSRQVDRAFGISAQEHGDKAEPICLHFRHLCERLPGAVTVYL
jgi:hypothetical protein